VGATKPKKARVGDSDDEEEVATGKGKKSKGKKSKGEEGKGRKDR
jgi:hypothetical protein